MPLLPEKTRTFPHMFWSNERVALLGTWKHGFFASTYIAATALVGKINLDADPELVTNTPASSLLKSLPYLTGWRAPELRLKGSHHPYGLSRRRGSVPVAGEEGASPTGGLHLKQFNPPLRYRRGDHIGGFSVGSGMVFVFEAPVDWSLKYDAMVPGHSFKLGEALTDERD